ncbi:hydrolase [Spongiactinospora rosea]|uniref:Hydrolase n=1 Tax=Spongiactinospora rosea TaxID=2248750 RepID=A0A366LU77_9ACTN|nr:serine hydrolase domain-containing protein [Spongiactinospora rosea]RBQ17317.1 hydrolase [Spongiactinospora rosea]
MKRLSRTTQLIVALGVAAMSLHAVPAAASTGPELDRKALQRSVSAVHEAGMYGIYSEVRDGRETWAGAAGVADVETRRPVHPRMEHRAGSITKSFVAVALLQQAERGTVDLDAPVARYLPGVLPADRAGKTTVRMLLNHTSHLGDYVAGAFPSLLEGSPKSLDDNRFRTITPQELVGFGLSRPVTGAPGDLPGRYANINYILAGMLLAKVTGQPAEKYITRHVIRPAGLKHTYFPRSPYIKGPHSKAYESLFGLIDPPRDYSVYDMSWGGMAGAVVSTMDDLNRFYRALATGRLIGAARLAEMRQTVPVQAGGLPAFGYGLGLFSVDAPCGRFWGHDGSVFGMLTISLTSEDGRRQVSLGLNLSKYQKIGEDGLPIPHPADEALNRHLLQGLCGTSAPQAKTTTPAFPLFPTQDVLVKRASS